MSVEQSTHGQPSFPIIIICYSPPPHHQVAITSLAHAQELIKFLKCDTCKQTCIDTLSKIRCRITCLMQRWSAIIWCINSNVQSTPNKMSSISCRTIDKCILYTDEQRIEAVTVLPSSLRQQEFDQMHSSCQSLFIKVAVSCFEPSHDNETWLLWPVLISSSFTVDQA